MAYFRVPRLRYTRGRFQREWFFDLSGQLGSGVYYMCPDRLDSYIKKPNPVLLKFEKSEDGMEKADTIEISVCSLFGKEYSAKFRPDAKGKLVPFGEGEVIKSYPTGEIISRREKDVKRMEKNIRLITESPRFKNKLYMLVSRDKINKDKFTEEMKAYLGLTKDDV